MEQPIQKTNALPVASPVASDLSVECRKGVNVEKPECVKWFDDLSKNKGSVSTGDNGQMVVAYNPVQPFDDQIQKSVSYQVTAKPVFSGCIKKNGRYVGYTQQGTIIDVSQDDCRRLLENNERPFNYFAQDQNQQSQRSVGEQQASAL